MYLELKHKNQFKRIYYFLIFLYDAYFECLNKNLIKNINNIIKDNFNDPTLL